MSAKEKTIGRPILGDAAKADVIRFRVTPAERERMEATATKKGKILSAWAREILLAASRK